MLKKLLSIFDFFDQLVFTFQYTNTNKLINKSLKDAVNNLL